MTFRVDDFALDISTPMTEIQERVYYIIQIRQFCMMDKSVISPEYMVYCSGDATEITISYSNTHFIIPFHFLDIHRCCLSDIKAWFIKQEEKATLERIERYSQCIKESKAYLNLLDEKLHENNIPF